VNAGPFMSLCDNSRSKPPRGGRTWPFAGVGYCEPMSIADRAYDPRWPTWWPARGSSTSGLAIAFGPLFDGQALRWHDRDRALQNPACRQLQPFTCSRRVTELNDIRKAAVAVGRAIARPGTPNDFQGEITRVRLGRYTLPHVTNRGSLARGSRPSDQSAHTAWATAAYRLSALEQDQSRRPWCR
jgi:hypothetical protein